MKHQKGHPFYSRYRSNNFRPVAVVALETSYPFTMWLIGCIFTLIFVAVMSVLLVGCDDTHNPTADMVDGADVINEFVGDTEADTETDTTDTLGVDMVENEIEDEVLISPCTNYEWLNNNFWCCATGGQCSWRTCTTEITNNQCFLTCENTLNSAPINYPYITFLPPNSFSVIMTENSTTECIL